MIDKTASEKHLVIISTVKSRPFDVLSRFLAETEGPINTFTLEFNYSKTTDIKFTNKELFHNLPLCLTRIISFITHHNNKIQNKEHNYS